MAVKIAIIVCTRNRAAGLPAFLHSIAELKVPEDFECSLCLVDNGSTDGTKKILTSFMLPNMAMQVLECPLRGKSLCLNLALNSSEADIYLFTDDDIYPPSNWIADIVEPILAEKADCVVGGLMVAPELEGAWLTKTVCSCIADTRFADRTKPIYLIGGNMAISRRVFAAIPEFNERLGPGQLGFCEETLFTKQADCAGFTIAERLEVIAEHHLGMPRLTRQSLMRSAYITGRSCGYIAYHWDRRFISRPRENIRRVIRTLRSWRKENSSVIGGNIGIEQIEYSLLVDIGFNRQYMLESRGRRMYPFNKAWLTSAYNADR